MKRIFIVLTFIMIFALSSCNTNHESAPIDVATEDVTWTHPPISTPLITVAPTYSPTDETSAKVIPDNSLGLSAKDFLINYNLNASLVDDTPMLNRNSDISGDYVTLNTTSEYVSFQLSIKNGLINNIFLKGKGGGTNTSAIKQMKAFCAALQTIDTSLSTSDASNFLTKLISSAPSNGDNYTKTNNGITYTVSAFPGDTMIMISK